MAERHRVGVVGAGTMGNGIAHVLAKAGLDVMLFDANAEALERGLATVRTNLDREAAKGKVDPAEVPAIHCAQFGRWVRWRRCATGRW